MGMGGMCGVMALTVDGYGEGAGWWLIITGPAGWLNSTLVRSLAPSFSLTLLPGFLVLVSGGGGGWASGRRGVRVEKNNKFK